MKKFMKKLALSLAIAVSAVAFFAISAPDANAYRRTECKWKQIECEKKNTFIEGCLVIGDGNTCDCGGVTRDCPDDNPTIE